MSLRIRFLPFVVKAIAFLIAISVVWYFVAPAYNHLLMTVSEKLSPSQPMLRLDQGTIYIYPQVGAELAGGVYASVLHYGLLLVAALIAATPGLKLAQRLKFIAIALIAIFAIHVVSIVLFVEAALSSTTAFMEQNPLIILFAVVGNDLFPVLIWGVVSFKYFFPKPESLPVPAAQPRLERRKHKK